ncbi:MAG: PDZ domain-containing protein [Planctomycetota bacterium]|jgi:hypothetical protein
MNVLTNPASPRPLAFALAAALTAGLALPVVAQDEPYAGGEAKTAQKVEVRIEKQRSQASSLDTEPRRIVIQRRTGSGDPAAEIVDRPVGQLTDGAIYHVTIDDESDAFAGTQGRQANVSLHPTTYLGVSAEPVPAELRAHLDVAIGQGLIVRFVAPNSGAQKAGLRENDILLQLNDQKLMNMQQLQSLIQSHETGDVVTLRVIHAGKVKSLDVTLGKRMAPKAQHYNRFYGSSQTPRQSPLEESDPKAPGVPMIEEPYINTERIQRELKELRESIKKHSGELADELKALADEASEEAARQSKIIAERALEEAHRLMEKVEEQQKMIMERIEEEQKANAARQAQTPGASSSAFSHSKTDRRETAVYHDGEHRLTLNVDAEGAKTLKVTKGDEVLYEGPVNNKLAKKLDENVYKKFKKLEDMIGKAGKDASN